MVGEKRKGDKGAGTSKKVASGGRVGKAVVVPQALDEPARTRLSTNGMVDFANEDALKWFNENCRTSSAIVEQHVLRNKVSAEVWDQLMSRGWDDWVSQDDEPYNLSQVREIFANARALRESPSTDAFMVRGRPFALSLEAIRACLGTPVSEEHYFDIIPHLAEQVELNELNFLTGLLCPEAAREGTRVATTGWAGSRFFWVKFIHSRLSPSSRHSAIGLEELKLIYAFENDLPVDASVVVYRKLRRFLHDWRANLIFPKLLTKMAKLQNIPERPNDVLVKEKIHPLVEDSKLARRKNPPIPSEIPQTTQPTQPPPHMNPPIEPNNSFQFQAIFQALNHLNGCMEDNRLFHRSREPLYNYMANQANIPTENFYNFPSQPYAFPPSVQQFIPTFPSGGEHGGLGEGARGGVGGDGGDGAFGRGGSTFAVGGGSGGGMGYETGTNIDDYIVYEEDDGGRMQD